MDDIERIEASIDEGMKACKDARPRIKVLKYADDVELHKTEDEIFSKSKEIYDLAKTGYRAMYACAMFKSIKERNLSANADKHIKDMKEIQKKTDEQIEEKNEELRKLRDKLNTQEVPKMNISIGGTDDEHELIKDKIISAFKTCSGILIEDKGDTIQLVFKEARYYDSIEMDLDLRSISWIDYDDEEEE